MFKKGQSMSINVIIVAVIALVIMVVLISIFAGRIGIVTDKTGGYDDNKCGADGENGRVVPFTSSCGEGERSSLLPYDDVREGSEKCCLPQKQYN